MMSFEQLQQIFPGNWRICKGDIFYISFGNGIRLMYDCLGFWTNEGKMLSDININAFIQKQIKLTKLKNFK